VRALQMQKLQVGAQEAPNWRMQQGVVALLPRSCSHTLSACCVGGQ
jgi:hypothetical protein